MTRYVFSVAERDAIWSAHEERCWLCGRPVGFGEMEVEHIIPVDLKKKPKEFADLKKSLNLPSDFEIESFENWRPSHRNCNGKKSGMAYDAPIVGIQITSNKAQKAVAKAKRIANRIVSDHELEKNIAAVLSALENKSARPALFDELGSALQKFSEFHLEQRTEERRSDPLDLGFGYLVADGALRVVKQPFGVGVGPAGPDISPHMRCPSCGNPYFNGARCTLCGTMDDD